MDDICHSVWCFALHLDQVPSEGVSEFAEFIGRLFAIFA